MHGVALEKLAKSEVDIDDHEGDDDGDARGGRLDGKGGAVRAQGEVEREANNNQNEIEDDYCQGRRALGQLRIKCLPEFRNSEQRYRAKV